VKILKILGASILALCLVLGSALPALAKSGPAPTESCNMPPKLLSGKVVGIDEGKTYFVIQHQGQDCTISVNSDTKYLRVSPLQQILPSPGNQLEQGQDQIKLRPMFQKILGLIKFQAKLKNQYQERIETLRQLLPPGIEAGFDDITIGTQVRVHVVQGEVNPLAKLVIIMKPITPEYVIGIITGISAVDKTITIAPAGGANEITLKYNEKTSFILHGITGLAEGQCARAVYDEEMVAKVIYAPVKVPEPID